MDISFDAKCAQAEKRIISKKLKQILKKESVHKGGEWYPKKATVNFKYALKIKRTVTVS